MGQYREAQTLITESYNGLKAALGDAAQVVGESQYYLALMPLLTADTEDAVALTDPMLLQVGFSFSVAINMLQYNCFVAAFFAADKKGS